MSYYCGNTTAFFSNLHQVKNMNKNELSIY